MAVGTLGRDGIDGLGTALHEVTFCVIDVETTGGAPVDGGITEVGAVKLRGGERLGTLQTLVNPGLAIPGPITALTGITQAMVGPAPAIGGVLPSLLEFVGGAVVVGHNVAYDLGFLGGALARQSRSPLGNRWVDTCRLARRLLGDEVPSCRLSTLAEAFALDHRPTHRALDDALATGDLLHLLLERAAGFGVFGLDDLLLLPALVRHPQAAKLRLTRALPRQPGVYLLRDARGTVLYVGRSGNLRRDVRSHFAGTGRGRPGQLLRELAAVDPTVCADEAEAADLAAELVERHRPRFNDPARPVLGRGRR